MRYIPDVVEISTAARLIKANVFVDGQRIGTDPNGFPVWCKHGAVVVKMGPNRESAPEDTAVHERVKPELIGMATERRSGSRKGGWA